MELQTPGRCTLAFMQIWTAMSRSALRVDKDVADPLVVLDHGIRGLG